MTIYQIIDQKIKEAIENYDWDTFISEKLEEFDWDRNVATVIEEHYDIYGQLSIYLMNRIEETLDDKDLFDILDDLPW